MRRVILYILVSLASIVCYAQSADDYKKLSELEQKLQAAQQTTDNVHAYLALMPELVEVYESIHLVNADYIRNLIYLGYFYYAQLDTQSAANTFNKANDILQKNPSIKSQMPDDLLELLNEGMRGLADLDKDVGEDEIGRYFKSGNYKEVLRLAHSHFQQRKEFVSNAYFSLSEQERNMMSQYVEKDLNLHYIISAVYYTNDFSIMGELYDYILFLKQLQLRTSKQINDAIKKSGDKQLISYYEEYNSLRKQLVLSNPPESFNRANAQSRLNSMGRMLALYGNIFKDADNISWKDIQKRLSSGAAAIEFVEFNLFEGSEIKRLQVYAAMIITPTCTQPILKLTNSKRNLTYWHPENPGDLYTADQYGAALGQLFWTDLLFFLANEDINTIYFAPDGILHTLAIESLPYDKESPMSWHYNLTRLSSTRELALKHNHYPKKTATLYGDLAYRLSSESMAQNSKTRSAIGPIPATKQELEDINRALAPFQYDVKVFSRQNGTEESAKALDGRSPSILHFATHGFVKENAGEDIMRNTGLVLSYGARAWEGRDIPKGVEDGILTAAEIETLDLSGTDVVVLSACNTALGEVTPEGVWGLQRAFKKAGVNTIIMSLWQVDDEATAVFMGYFYEALMNERKVLDKIINVYKGDPEDAFDYTHSALQTAQNRMREHPKYNHPYFWAAFIAIM